MARKIAYLSYSTSILRTPDARDEQRPLILVKAVKRVALPSPFQNCPSTLAPKRFYSLLVPVHYSIVPQSRETDSWIPGPSPQIPALAQSTQVATPQASTVTSLPLLSILHQEILFR
ncbi:hypothetical protein BofuT4_P114040.1 [Botrytis cinerea T4]|uniref:Uncharacterized protein n=1 Tax=Botryotinia fuckeliana (strain T4) TaxID=999810 RepID=G2Y5G0_BOTF4|nr:hypothetical protein BofuT4_P114040.1 [Botrytis cinerea T4]